MIELSALIKITLELFEDSKGECKINRLYVSHVDFGGVLSSDLEGLVM